MDEMLKNKVIIIAEGNNDLAKEISSYIRKQGFNNIEFAEDGEQVYKILRPFYNEPEKIGLIIVNEYLPKCHVPDMCRALSSNVNAHAHVIPFIILHQQTSFESIEKKNSRSLSINNSGLNRPISLPINYAELLIIIEFQLMMKHERFLRYQQEDILINELAERKVVDAKLKYLIIHDELTNLLNRQNFESRLHFLLNQDVPINSYSALLFIDIDRFSLINELEGFEAGDKLLTDIVSLIRNMIGRDDLFARIGSDEFCIFFKNDANDNIKHYADSIRKNIYDFRFFTSDVGYSISLSIGISKFKSKPTISHPSEIISQAQQACNMAKASGRNLVLEYNEDDNSVQERRRDISLAPLIKNALLKNKFYLVYQPVVNLTSGDISHYEALIRMRNDETNTIYPSEFIPVAERMGLIHNIDLWVISEAIDFLANLPADKIDLSIAINLSGYAFQDASLLPAIKDKLNRTWVDAQRITFEITETAAVENFEQTREMIMKIRALGCKFALDDFGAGFCSFNYLKSFPVDYVKIDGQFIRNLLNDQTDKVLVKSMAEIASKLGKKTIAEFVETPETIITLREMGIDFAQGYLFGKPEPTLLTSNSISIKDLLQSTHNQLPTQLCRN